MLALAALPGLLSPLSGVAGAGIVPDNVAFGPTPLSGSEPVTLVVHNGEDAPLTLGAVALGGAEGSAATAFVLDHDNCSNQPLAAGAECSLSVIFRPPTVSGTYSAILSVPTGDNSALHALLHNGESDREWAQRRIPPVLTALSVPQSVTVDESYALRWSVRGYSEKLRSRVALIDCSNAISGCEAGGETLASELLEPESYAAADWGREGAQAHTLGYRYEFTLDRTRFPDAPGDLLLQFSQIDESDYLAGRESLPLHLGGGLGSGYTELSNVWRIPLAAPAITFNDPAPVTDAEGTVSVSTDSLARPAAAEDTITLVAIEGQAIAAGQSITLASEAVVSLDAEGNLHYTPPASAQTLGAGQSSIEVIRFTVRDSYGSVVEGSFSVTIEGVNDAPTATSPARTLSEDETLPLSLGGDLAGDVDSGDTLSLVSIDGSAVSHGQRITLVSGAVLEIDTGGNLHYTPAASAQTMQQGESVSDSFAYTVSDSQGSTAGGTVSLTIEGRNDAPMARADRATLPERLDGLIFHQYSGEPASLDALGGTPDMSGWSANLDVANLFGKGLVFEGELQIDTAGDYTFHLSTDGEIHEVAEQAEETGEESETTETKLVVVTRVEALGEADLAINGQPLLASGGSASVYLEVGRHPIRVRYLADSSHRALSLEYEGPGIGRQTVPAHALFTGHGLLDLLANDSDADRNDSLTISAVDGQALSVDTPVTLASGARVTLRDDGLLAYDPTDAFAPLAGEATHSDSFRYTVADNHGASAEAEVAITLTTTDSIVSTLRDGVTLDYRPEPTRTRIILKNPTGETLSIDLVVSDTTDGSETERHRLALPPGGSVTQYLDTIAYPDAYPKLVPDIHRRVDVVYREGYRIAGQAADGPTGPAEDSAWALNEILVSAITLTALGSTYTTSHFEVHNGNLIPIHIKYSIDGVLNEMTLAAGETRLMVEPYDVVVSLILYDKIFVSLPSYVIKLMPAFKEQIVIEGVCRTNENATFAVTNNNDEAIVLTVGTSEGKSVSVGAGASTTFEVVYVPQITVKVKDAILGVFLPNDERCGMQFDFTVDSVCTEPATAFLYVTNNNPTTGYSIKLQSQLVRSLETPFTDIRAEETKSFIIYPQGFELRGTEGALYVNFGDKVLQADTFTFSEAGC